MARAGGGANAPSSSFASLERTLDKTIERLVGGPQTREARALLIEARRLRSVVANWRSIPPPPAVHDEMFERIVQLSQSVGAAFPEVAEELSLGGGVADEETEGYAFDFEPQLYSLETATNPNRQAIPLPQTSGHDGGYPQPPGHDGHDGGYPPTPAPERSDAPVNSEEEPTRAWSNASVKPPPDFEPDGPAPAPWPVDEAPERISSIVTNGRSGGVPAQPVTHPHVPAAPPVASLAVPPPSLPMPSLLSYTPPGAAPSSELVLHEEAPAHAAYLVTYDFDAEGDDLSVPRTQIAVHAVKLSDPVNPLLVALTDAYSPRADAYRTLRRKLAATPTTRVLGVTSAGPGEGKTVFALNLALTLRESARSRVLVIEANLRAPMMAKMLGFDTPDCFIEQVQRHAEDPRAPWVVAEPLPKFHVMAIDPRTPHQPLLDPVTFSAGMDRIKQAGYEYVIVDAPPVLGSLDCNVISDTVDAMILTALPMISMRREMRKAVEQLDPAPILGVVVLEV